MRLCVLCKSYEDHLERLIQNFEYHASNDGEIREAEPPEARELLRQADVIRGEEPKEALELVSQAAQYGSVVARRWLGWHHATGAGTEEDLHKAVGELRQAFEGGSQMAMIDYAYWSAKSGNREEAERVYRLAIEAGYVPAYYWLSRHHYDAKPTRKTAKLVEPWLEKAVEAGHPGARLKQLGLLLKGRYGFRGIARGARLFWSTFEALRPAS